MEYMELHKWNEYENTPNNENNSSWIKLNIVCEWFVRVFIIYNHPVGFIFIYLFFIQSFVYSLNSVGVWCWYNRCVFSHTKILLMLFTTISYYQCVNFSWVNFFETFSNQSLWLCLTRFEFNVYSRAAAIVTAQCLFFVCSIQKWREKINSMKESVTMQNFK